MIDQILIDSNIIIRFFIKDNPTQLIQAQSLIENIEQAKVKGLISLLVVNEVLWILQHYYDLERKIFIPWIIKLLALRHMRIIEVKKNTVIRILEKMQERKFDFTDIYLTEIAEKNKIFSFDQDLQKLIR